jgi:hypothetical protein
MSTPTRALGKLLGRFSRVTTSRSAPDTVKPAIPIRDARAVLKRLRDVASKKNVVVSLIKKLF